MNAFELMVADVASTGVTTDMQPMEMVRSRLREQGVITARELPEVEDGTRVWIAGVVTHRQRPKTAQGVTFMSMEDETGLLNVCISVGLWERFRVLARTAKTLKVRGRVRNLSGACTIDADWLEPVECGQWLTRSSRDFQ